MRIYYIIDGVEIDSDDYRYPIVDLAHTLHICIMERTKYKIMWALRSLEQEIKNSVGVILIKSNNWQDEVKISAKDFDAELATKIQNIAVKTKL